MLDATGNNVVAVVWVNEGGPIVNNKTSFVPSPTGEANFNAVKAAPAMLAALRIALGGLDLAKRRERDIVKQAIALGEGMF